MCDWSVKNAYVIVHLYKRPFAVWCQIKHLSESSFYQLCTVIMISIILRNLLFYAWKIDLSGQTKNHLSDDYFHLHLIVRESLMSCLLAFRGVSPGCHLINTASMLVWLRLPPPPPLTGEHYGKMELKYPEGGHCPSVLHPQGVFNFPHYFNNSVETAAPFNVVSHPRCCEPRN